jgi:glucose-1-phosphate thymidylyltransferase
VIVTRPDQTMEKIVEKPKTPISKLANIGLYYIRDSALLFEGINEVLRNPKGSTGEYYLTDAFQYMVDKGAQLLVAPVEGWYDCGKPDTLLETNHHLLVTGRGGIDKSAQITGAELIEPLRIEEGVRIDGGRIGPNVTVGKGTRVVRSELRDVIVGENAVLENVKLHDSLLGNAVQAKGLTGVVSLGDHSEVAVD